MFEFDAKELWKERISQTAKEYSQYLKYIFNGHLVIVLVFLLGTGAYYYQAWINQLSDQFPAAWIMSLVLGFFLTRSSIYTLLKDADRIFLIPVETRMTTYFHRSIVLSFIIQAYILVLILSLLMPMYAAIHNGDYRDFWFFLIVLLLAKAINLLIRWRVQHFVNKNTHYIDSCIRFCLNFVLLLLLFSNASPLFFISILIIQVLLLLYYQRATERLGIKWELLIEQDEKRLAAFYQLANMFTDVPKLKNRIKRRKILDVLVENIGYKQNKVFSHLYGRTFLRAGDFLGLTIRLTVIAGIALYYLSFGIGQILLAVLFLFLTGLQLLPLWNAYQDKIWVNLYPLPDSYRKKSFKQTIATVLFTQSFVLPIVIILKGEFMIGIMALLVNLVFTFFFVSLYMNKKIQNG